MKYLYQISITTSAGRQASWGIVATSMAAAVAKAQAEAGVGQDVEPLTAQRLAQVDFEVA